MDNDDDDDKKKKMKILPIFKQLQATHKLLTPEEKTRAHLVKASKIAFTDGKDFAQQYMDQMPSTQGYKIDPDLSTNDALVVQTPQSTSTDPHIELAFRGTVFPKLSLSGRQSFRNHESWQDLKQDARVIMTGSSDYPEGDQLIESIQQKYGVTPEHSTGYSLGAYRSNKIAVKHDIPSTEFNPLISPKGRTTELSAPQTSLLITDNLTSLPYGWTKKDPKRTIKTFVPLDNTTNPIEVHSLDKQFLNRTQENVPLSEAGYLLANQDYGMRASQMKLMDTVEEDLSNGKTFTQFMDIYNRRHPEVTDRSMLSDHRNVKTDPATGEPVFHGAGSHAGTQEVLAWAEGGGAFTNNELKAINNREWSQNPLDTTSPSQEEAETFLNQISENHAGSTLGMSADERRKYRGSSREDRDKTMEESTDILNKYNDQYFDPQSTSTMNDFAPRGMGDQIRGSFGASGLTTGLVGSMMAQQATNMLDPNNQVPDMVKVPLAGGAANFFTALAQRAAGSPGSLTKMTVPAGIAGAAVSYGTEKLVDYTLDKIGVSKFPRHEVADFLGDIAGGAAMGGLEGGLAGAGIGAAVGGGFGLAKAADDLGKIGLEKLGATKDEAELGADTAVGAAVGGMVAGPVGGLVGGIGGAIYGGVKDLWNWTH